MLLYFVNDTATTEIYTLSLHDALPICIDFIMGQAATLLQYVPRPFQNKVQHLFLNHYMNTYLWRRATQRPNRARDCQGKREWQFGFDQDFYDSHSRTAQRERVARPGRDQAHREAAHQRVELVRERDGLARKVSRNGIIERSGPVVIVYRPGHILQV